MSDADYQAGWDAGFHKGLTATEGFTGHDMAQAREDGYSAGLQRAAEYEQVLLDLIAELKERHRPTPSGHLCEDCQEDYLWPCPVTEVADRAEARLRELDAPTEDGNERIN